MESLDSLNDSEESLKDSETLDATLGTQQSQDGGPELQSSHGMEQNMAPLGLQMETIHSTKKTVESEILRLQMKTQDLGLQLGQLEENTGDTAPVELALRAAERALQRLLESQRRTLEVQQQLHKMARERASLSRDGGLGLNPALPTGSTRLPVPGPHESEPGDKPPWFTEVRGGFGPLMRDGLHRAHADPNGRLLGSNSRPQHSNEPLGGPSSSALRPGNPDENARIGARLPVQPGTDNRVTARQFPEQPRESRFAAAHPGQLGTESQRGYNPHKRPQHPPDLPLELEDARPPEVRAQVARPLLGSLPGPAPWLDPSRPVGNQEELAGQRPGTSAPIENPGG